MAARILHITLALVAGAFLAGGLAPGTQAAGTVCSDPACFEQAVQDCSTVEYMARDGLGAARYQVEERVDASSCRLALTFVDNPNPAWVDQPLRFVLDTTQAIEPQLKAAVAACLTGAGGEWQCDGPLLEAIGGASARSSAATPSAEMAAPPMPALTGGSATFALGGDTMNLAWRGDGNMRLDSPDSDDHLIIRNNKAYMVTQQDGEIVAIDMSEIPALTPDDLRDMTFMLDTVVSVEAIGEHATVAGMEGEVYRFTTTNQDGKTERNNIVLTGAPSVVAMTEAWMQFMQATLDSNVLQEAFFSKLPQDRRGLLRTGDDFFELMSVSANQPSAAELELPAEPMSMDEWMQYMGN